MAELTVRSVIGTALMNKALEDLTLKAAISDATYPDGRAFLLAAPDDANLPYLKVEWVYGGEPAKSPRREFDQLWIVCITDFNQFNATELDRYARDKLVGATLTFSDSWQAWDKLTVANEYEKVMLLQGNSIWSIGAYYRIRGIKQ